MKKKFSLGFWNYTDPAVYGKECVKDWVDCGMNLVLSPHFVPEKHNPAILLEILDECEKSGIQVIIDDARALNTKNAHVDPEEYRQRFQAAFHDFGSHPATYGFYIGDEPWFQESPPHSALFDDVATANKIQLEVAPNLIPFLNVNPYWRGVEDIVSQYTGESYLPWMETYSKESQIKILSYDCYQQMNVQTEEERGIHDYYDNLRIFSTLSRNTGIPFWVSNLAVPHFRYRQPTEDDFRWQLNTSVASGASCVWWFFMYMRLTRINYRVAPIDEHGEKTEAYHWLRRVQRSFLHNYGELFGELIHDEALHYKKAYGEYPLFSENTHPWVEAIESDCAGLLSFFHDDRNRTYMVIVNNSQTESDYVTCHFMNAVKAVYRIAWGGEEINAKDDRVCNAFAIIHNKIQNRAILAPGQMEVYRLEFEPETL